MKNADGSAISEGGKPGTRTTVDPATSPRPASFVAPPAVPKATGGNFGTMGSVGTVNVSTALAPSSFTAPAPIPPDPLFKLTHPGP